MKPISYLQWTDETLRDLNIIAHLHQPLHNLIPPFFIPTDNDLDFSQRLNTLVSATDSETDLAKGNVFHALAQMGPGEDQSSSNLLLALIEHVTLPNPKLFFSKSPHLEYLSHASERHVNWCMSAAVKKWWALHRECISIRDRRKSGGKDDPHIICGRAYASYILVQAEDSDEDSDSDESVHMQLPPEGERKDEIAKDVGMLCSQVAACVKATNRILDHEAFVWGMCDARFYIVRGSFDASYIEAVRILSAPLPASYAAEVYRTAFYDMETFEGRREALRGVMALLRYTEWKYERSRK